MIDKFKEFIAKQRNVGSLTPEEWVDLITDQLPQIIREREDPSFNSVWERSSDYYTAARNKFVVDDDFRSSCEASETLLQGLRFLSEFLAEESRKEWLGKSTKKSTIKDCASQKTSDGLHSPKIDVLEEGEIIEMHISKHERNSALRKTCIEYYASCNNGHIMCAACKMEFGKIYGALGEGYIEVHHLNPISQIEGIHSVDPKVDLVPLCANCHAMIHRIMKGESIEGVFALERLQEIIEDCK